MVSDNDDVYASYFRAEPPEPPDTPATPESVPSPAPDPEQGADPLVAPVVDPDAHPESMPTPVEASAGESAADTGRLFRSQGVVGHEVAVLALTSDHGGRLRTLQREAAEVPSAGPEAGSHVDAVDGAEQEVGESRMSRARQTRASQRSGISAGAVYIIVFGLTLAVAFVNAWLSGGTLGWPTGVALVVASVYCALRVRREDDVVAMFVPPLAFFVASITAGQLLLGAQAGSLLNRAQKGFFTLADNWYWIIGATLAAVIIVLIRRRRS